MLVKIAYLAYKKKPKSHGKLGKNLEKLGVKSPFFKHGRMALKKKKTKTFTNLDKIWKNGHYKSITSKRGIWGGEGGGNSKSTLFKNIETRMRTCTC